METNRLVLSGTVTELTGLRYTPAGVPHQAFLLEHRSRQEEAGAAREVLCHLKVEARGEAITATLQDLALGSRVIVTGFLARSHFKDTDSTRLVLHAQHIELR